MVFEQVFGEPAGERREVHAAGLGHRDLVGGHVQAGRVAIEVRYCGPGLPAGDEERVFDKFHRGPNPGVPGVGLGLSICRAIVEAHGGTIAGGIGPTAARSSAWSRPRRAPSMLPPEPAPERAPEPEVAQ